MTKMILKMSYLLSKLSTRTGNTIWGQTDPVRLMIIYRQ